MQAVSQQEFSDLVLMIYDAARDPNLWNVFLDRLTAITESDGGALLVHDIRTQQSAGVWSGYDPAEADRYFQHYCHINPWMPRPESRLVQGDVLRSELVLPHHELQQTEFYTDWGKKNHTVYSLGANLVIDKVKFVFLSMNRGESRGPQTDEAAGVLQLLVPHLRSAVSIQEKLSRLGQLIQALDHLAYPVFLLDQNGKVLEMTAGARRSHVAPNARGVVESQAVRGALVELASSAAPAVMFHCRGSVAVLMRAESARMQAPAGRYLLILIEPGYQHRAGLEMLGRLYGLTRAELRLAETLAATGGAAEAIEALGVSRNTAKTQMAAILRKTGARRQGDVIRLVTVLGRVGA